MISRHLCINCVKLKSIGLLVIPRQGTSSPVWSWTIFRGMKRKAFSSGAPPKAKRQREPEKDYCDVEPQKNDAGEIIWPAPMDAIESARALLREWYVNCPQLFC